MNLIYSLFDLYFRSSSALAAISRIQPEGTQRFNSVGNLVDSNGVDGALFRISDEVLDVIFLIVGILAVLYLIWMGIQYIMSAGSPDKAKVARQGVINAVIGIIIVVAAYAIVRFAVSIGRTINGVI